MTSIEAGRIDRDGKGKLFVVYNEIILTLNENGKSFSWKFPNIKQAEQNLRIWKLHAAREKDDVRTF